MISYYKKHMQYHTTEYTSISIYVVQNTECVCVSLQNGYHVCSTTGWFWFFLSFPFDITGAQSQSRLGTGTVLYQWHGTVEGGAREWEGYDGEERVVLRVCVPHLPHIFWAFPSYWQCVQPLFQFPNVWLCWEDVFSFGIHVKSDQSNLGNMWRCCSQKTKLCQFTYVVGFNNAKMCFAGREHNRHMVSNEFFIELLMHDKCSHSIRQWPMHMPLWACEVWKTVISTVSSAGNMG